ELPAALNLPPPPDITEKDLNSFDQDDPEQVAALVRKLAGAPRDSTEPPAALWDRAALPYLMMDWLRYPRSEKEVLKLLGERPERQGVDAQAVRSELEAALLVGPCLPDHGAVKIRPRVHRFLRGLARFWRCTNPGCGKLLGEGIGECDQCGSKSLPLALCRTCGWDFFVAVQPDEGQALQPWTWRRSTKDTLFLYDPPRARVEVDPEVDASGSEDEDDEPATADVIDDEPEREPEATQLGLFDRNLDPMSLRLLHAGQHGPPGTTDLLRPVLLHKGRGTRCPVCSSRYGSYDVLTPVSLGNSSALTHVSRVLMNGLPLEQRKLLVFCDSRQDASHQARFVEASEDRVRLRRLVYSLLAGEQEPHDLEWLVDGLHDRYVRQGRFAKTKKKDQLKREKDKVLGELLSEFVISPRVRAGLERMGLVKVRYAGLDEAFAGNAFQRLCAEHQLRPGVAAHATRLILDEMRQRMAVNHEVFRTRLFANDRLASRFGIQVNRYIGKPVAFLPPSQKSADTRSYKLFSTWNTKGSPTAIQRLWQHLHRVNDAVTTGTAASLETLLDWLLREGYLASETIGGEHEQAEGYQVSQEQLEFEAGLSFRRCSVCDRVAANERDEHPCDRPNCSGRMLAWAGPIAEGNLNALMAVQDYAPPLYAAEHSAAVTEEDREKAEDGFMNRTPPRPNLLACTPTLEMGVNIGDLEAVAMRNIPPSPAHYAQRSGRTGRVSRMGIVAGFSRNTPHDGYFFDHPGEIISGAIPPPRFNLDNLEALARHVRSLVLEHAELDIPQNLANYLTEKGQPIEPAIKDLLTKIQAGAQPAVSSARRLWPDLPAAPADFFEAIAAAFPEEVKATLVERGKLLSQAAEEVRKLGEKIKLTPKEDQAQSGYRLLAIRLREDNRYAYLPRVLAEAGLLPGYSFPTDPGSVALGYQPEPVFGGRLQAQREFAPGQIVYARGGRWRVTGVALHRPGSPAGPDQSMFKFTLCGCCGLANRPNLNFCARCQSPIGDDDGAGLKTFTAWDASAFQ
ncbi:MAG TPA: helicase-related protein, partial [Isosphaeraceae bacterium]|nr:helicase-related protein [Isosphaeraceae bacterium]